jgi:peptide/nickel transport system substrate-binding protein
MIKRISTACPPRSLLLTRRAAAAAAAAALMGLAAAGSVWAATPRDTLVIAAAFDDIISLDPAEAFEISAGEIMGNAYDRLLRYDVNDPSKLLPDLAKGWTVSADGRTFSFELRAGMKFASGNPITAEDVVF